MQNPADTPDGTATSHSEAGRLEVGKLAYHEARNAFEMVNDQFSTAMNRIVQILTFSVASISFLAGQVLGNDLGPVARGASIAAGILTAVFCLYTIKSLMPAKNWYRGLEGGKIVDRYIRADIGAGDAVGAYEKVARLVADDATRNQITADTLIAKIPWVGGLAAASFCGWLLIAIAVS